MRIYKIFICALMALSIISAGNVTKAETSANALLAKIERETYGETREGAILPRLNELEKDYSGQNLQEDMNTRIEALYNILYDNSATPGLLAKLNAVEWNLNHEVNYGGIETRIDVLEEKLFGESNDGNYISRIRELVKASFGSEDIPMYEIQLPANTAIKVALVNPIGTRDGQVGDAVTVRVVEDVIIDDALVFAKGLYGTGVVDTLKKPNGWGSNGKLIINFNKLTGIDGQEIETCVEYEAISLMTEKKMIDGAALVGVNLNDDWNKALVHGKNLEIPADTELYIQIKSDTAVYALKGGRGSVTLKTSGADENTDDLIDPALGDDFYTKY